MSTEQNPLGTTEQPARTGEQPASLSTARAVFAHLIDAGIRDFLLSPGSRSAPLAYAAAEAETAGLATVHVRIDERSAGFMALGMAQATGRPVGIIVTSGTAVGELLPAVMEAHHCATPLLVLSADRPEELQGTGASQTTAQRALFAQHTRASLNVAAGEPPAQALDRALRALAGDDRQPAGPVQLNLQFRDPLVPEADSRVGDQAWTGHTAAGQWRNAPAAAPHWPTGPLPARRTVVLAGHGAGEEAQRFAARTGLPLFAEPSSNARFSAAAISHYRLLLANAGERIERVVLFGRPTLSRPVGRLLADPRIATASWQPGPVPWYEPGRRREQLITDPAALVEFAGQGPQGWLEAWQALDAQAGRLAGRLEEADQLGGYQLARAMWQHRSGPLFIGSSNIIRDFDLSAVPGSAGGPRVYANRGLAGIDGSISTALGIARGSGQPTRAVLGDITFLHEASALLLAPDEPRPTLDVVVYNDAGGAIFSTLEHGAVHESGAYDQNVERFFATPHRADIRALAAAYGWDYACPHSVSELDAVLAAPQRGVRIIEVRAGREYRRHHAQALADRAARLPWPAGS